MKTYHIMGTCHIDLAWHGDEAMYADYLEQFTVILLDLMEQYPDMTYMIEQAYHYRSLEKRRPDLVRRLRALVEAGRIEVVGGMASTMDSNMPCGESFIRNQLYGLHWFEAHMGAKVTTGWVVDAFGSPANLPQIMAGFGIYNMMGTRFGGAKREDVFLCVGLDGEKLLIVGRDCFSLNLPPPERSRIFFEFVQNGRQIDEAYARMRKTQLSGPILADVYVEDETYPNRRIAEGALALMRDAQANGDRAFFSLPRNFFRELRETTDAFPEESADLNPEFTGTYANRVEIRLQNRKTETALLQAEKWLALLGEPRNETLHEAWWDMAFVQFHDVFTGSTPDCTYQDVLSRLGRIRATADTVTEDMFAEKGSAVRVVNGLPFERTAWVKVPWDISASMQIEDGSVPSAYENSSLYFLASVPGCASKVYLLKEAEKEQTVFTVDSNVLENEYIKLTVDAREGVSLTEKRTNRVLLNNAKDFLVLQGDQGNFQIEDICSPEQYAWAAPVQVERLSGAVLRASGNFVEEASWTLDFTLRPGDRMLGVQVNVRWQAEGKRLRLKLNTSLQDAGDGIYEVPFGVVHRRAYTPGFCKKGEWPTQRFAAVEDQQGGLALINDGVPGVEILGGTMLTTLLRSPTASYAGMIPDETSFQHGSHTFAFALYPYQGNWQDSDVLRLAQGWNEPMRVYTAQNKESKGMESHLTVDSPFILLSAVKYPEEEGKDGLILRLHEETGRTQVCVLAMPGLVRAWETDLQENIKDEIPVTEGKIHLRFAPWQSKTLYVEREKKHE